MVNQYADILGDWQKQINETQSMGRISTGAIPKGEDRISTGAVPKEQLSEWWEQYTAPRVPQESPSPSWWQRGLQALEPVGEFFERGGAGLYGAVAHFGEATPFEETRREYEELPMWAKIPLEIAHPAGWMPVTGALKAGGMAARAAKLEPAARGLEATAAGLEKAAAIPGRLLGGMTRRRIKPLEITSNTEILARAWKPTALKGIAEAAGKVPVIRGVARRTVGPAAITKDTDVAARVAVVHGTVMEQLRSGAAMVDATLRNTIGDARRLFSITDDAVAHLGKGDVPIYDLLDNPTKYKAWLTPEQQKGVNALLEARDHVANLYRREGIWPELGEEGGDFFHRTVLGVQTSEGIATKPVSAIRGEAGLMQRIYATQAQGIKKGIAYEPDPIKSVLSQINAAGRIVAKKRTIETASDAMAKTIATTHKKARGKYGLGWINLTGEEARRLGLNPAKVKRVGGTWETVSAEEAAKRGIATDGPIEMITMAERAVSERPLKGIVFPEAIARDIEAAFNTEAQGWLQRMAKVAASVRMLVANLDLSAPFIQGLPVLGRRPDVWLQATGKQLKFFMDPKKVQRFMADEAATMAEMKSHGSIFQTFELAEALPMIQKHLPPVGKKILGATYGRSEAAFTGYALVARVKMWKALAPSIERKFGNEGLDDLARSLDRMVGMMSTEALGLTGTQRAFETALGFFSPRYTKAGFALVGDLFKGPTGVSGMMAWRSLGQLAGGGMAFFYGVSRAMGNSHEETMKRLDPRTARFMTLEIDGKPIGIGGMLYGIIRLAGNIASAGSDVLSGEKTAWDIVKPFDEGGLNRWDNPFVRFMMGKTSPLTSSLSLLIEEQNYFGEPFETPADYAKFLGSRVLPIWVQSQVVEGEPSALLAGAEFTGLRGWALGPEYEAGQLKDKFSQELYQKDWRELEIDEQAEIRRAHPEIEEAERQSQEIWAERGFAKAEDWLNWQRDLDDVRENVWLTPLEQQSTLYDRGKISGYKYREVVGNIGAAYGAAIEKLERDYPDLYKDLAEKTIDPDKGFNVAVFEYNRDIRFADDLDTPEGYEWDERERRETEWQQKYPQFIERLDAYLQGQRQEEPQAYQMLRWARETLKPYWEIEENTLKEYGLWETEQYADYLDNIRQTDKADYIREVSGIKALKEMIADYRRHLRMSDPNVYKAYEMFYAR